ncbi:MAG: hypothetical protein FWG69_02380 [Oscillospiraceae bacterium]|nr:hypothetical protein [Oscillospiraceae bacterium]
MAYKSTQEMIDHLKHYNFIIEKIPETFEVHGEYLIDGMIAGDFILGYKEYRDLIKNLNERMIASPESFGLVADKKGIEKPVNTIHYPYLWLFIALARSGEVRKGLLYVNGAEFLAYAKGKTLGSHNAYPKNIESMINKLSEYGFDITGYKHREPVDFTIEYKSNPYLLPVIKASTLSQYQAKSLVSDYACFNALMFKTAPKEKMLFPDTHTAKLMPQHLIEFITTAISEFGKIGLNQMAERHHKHNEGWMKFKYYQIYYSPNNIFTLFDITNHEIHEKYLESLPEKYFNTIKDHINCKTCRKNCKTLRVGELFGKKRAWCNSSRLRFPCDDINDISIVIDIITTLYGKKSR